MNLELDLVAFYANPRPRDSENVKDLDRPSLSEPISLSAMGVPVGKSGDLEMGGQ